VSRLPQTIVVLSLLVATATAFAVTERLKLEKSPVTGTQVDKIFSPVCECSNDVAVVSFRLRKPETVTVDILNSHGDSVATLVRNQHEQAGRVSYTWEGRTDLGLVASEGIYRPRVRLRAHGRTIVLPNPIRVDTTPPTIRLVRLFPKVLSPGIDGRHDRLTALYQSNERARALMLVDGRQRVLARFRATKGRLRWFGLVGGHVVAPGSYDVRLRAVDQAGNRSASTKPFEVHVQYIGFRRTRVRAVAGRRFAVRVTTYARAYRWVFNRKRGSARKNVLLLRAPTRAGTFPLYVRVGAHAARATIVVRTKTP
jgi:FlgD Ig-like domain